MGIRMGDINFVIDHILAETKSSNIDRVYELIDTAEIGVMGHSLGGSAALGIGRMRGDVSAVIALESPFMYDIEGVKDGEFVFINEEYPVPVLNVYRTVHGVISQNGRSMLKIFPCFPILTQTHLMFISVVSHI